MNRGSTGKEGELLGGVKRGREKQQQSVHQLPRAETVCWHSVCTCLWKREGEVKGGRTVGEGSECETAPWPLVASCSTSGDLYVNLTAFCQRAFVTYFILSRFFARGLKRLHCWPGVHTRFLTINSPRLNYNRVRTHLIHIARCLKLHKYT